MVEDLKSQVREFWDAASCGEKPYAIGADVAEAMAAQARSRRKLEPYLAPFADFPSGAGRHVLEIGVGMGADHVEWARHRPALLAGVDLTPRAIAFTKARLEDAGLHSDLKTADAEALPFPDGSFDIVYAWGVLHHSPDTAIAFKEVARVLAPDGVAKIMIYHKWSLTGLMLWLRYGLMKAQPFLSLDAIYAKYLESPGTKAYTVSAARQLCVDAGFASCTITIQLNHGDLLVAGVGQRHQGTLLNVAKRIWPRWLIKRVGGRIGTYLMITAFKNR